MEILDHLEFGLEAEIRNAIMGINTPAELVYARQYGYNDTTKRINIFDGTGVNYLLQDNDISIDADFTVDANKLTTRDAIRIYVESVIGGVGSFRDDHDASGGAVPTATNIKSGDYWRVSVGGTIAGLSPVETVNAGDLLFARIDDASTAADFFAVQGNFATAADVALLSTGSYGGLATNVQGALEELYSRTNPFDLGNGLGYQTGTGTGTGTKLHVLYGAGLGLNGSNALEVNLSDFVSGAAATGTEILASIGTGVNVGKIILDSADITAAIGDYLPLSGTTAGNEMTGGIFFEKDSNPTVFMGYPIGMSGDPSGAGVTAVGSLIGFGNGIISMESYSVGDTPWKGLRYLTGFSPSSFTPLEQSNGYMNNFVPDIAYVKTLISGGVDFSTKAGQGINYTGSIYNIDLDTNSGLELNGTSPDGKLRIKGLADYSAVIAGNQVPLGFNVSGNLIADKSLLGLADYLPLAGNTAGTPMTGDIFFTPGFKIVDKDASSNFFQFTHDTNTLSLVRPDSNAWLTVQATYNGTYDINSKNGNTQREIRFREEAEIWYNIQDGIDAVNDNMFMIQNRNGFNYSTSYHARWNTLAVGVRDRILPDIGYVKSLIGSSVDFAAKAGDGINYTGSIYNIDLDTNSGLELNGTSPDGKLRIKGLADYSAVAGGDQVALGYGTGGNLVINKALLVGDYLPLTGTAGADVLSGTVKLASDMNFFLDDTTTQTKLQFRNADGFGLTSQSTDTTKNAWFTANGSTGESRMFTSNSSAQNATVSVGLNGLMLSAYQGALDATVRMDATRNGLYYNADYSTIWNGLTLAERNRVIPDIAYVGAAITAAGRQSFDITGNGATRIYNITHTRGTFPIVQIYRVDTGAIVTATVTNISATETRITFAANVPLGRVHKVVIL